MKFFLILLIVFYDLCFGYYENLSGFNLYYTDIRLNNNDHHCLYYFVSEEDFVYQFIEYCIRFLFDDEGSEDTNKENSFTFEDLCKRNMTSQQFYEWSAPINLIESYQNYLENNISTNKFRFYNCQCHFQQPLPYFDEHIPQIYNRKNVPMFDISPTLSYYTYPQCNCASNQDVCLDWRELCNGKIDCDNKTEYRCQNGLCISLVYLQDDKMRPNCLDRSDEPRIINSENFLRSCHLDPTFRCEKSMCHPSNNKIHQIVCSDGSCVNGTDEWVGYHLS